MRVLEIASPLEVAALWRLGLLSGADIAFICMRWLEEDLDQGDASIAAFAGEPRLLLSEATPAFERVLEMLVARRVDHDEAMLIGLHLHLSAALQGELMENVRVVIGLFRGATERRLVHHPRRANDNPDTTFAEENLGLEYVYGGYYAFDDIEHWPPAERGPAEEALRAELHEHVQELRDHLGVVLQASAAGLTHPTSRPATRG